MTVEKRRGQLWEFVPDNEVCPAPYEVKLISGPPLTLYGGERALLVESDCNDYWTLLHLPGGQRAGWQVEVCWRLVRDAEDEA